MTNRLNYIDAIAGIMIIWMILGHCSTFSSFHQPYRVFLSFYMPWFFYKSGMFFSTKKQKDLLRKDLSKYIKPFVVYSLIGYVVWCVCGLLDGSQSLVSCMWRPIRSFYKSGCVVGNGALWFLLTLFLTRQIGNTLIKRKCPLPIISILCFMIAFVLYTLRWYQHSWWFGNLFSGLCFFLLGYYLKEKEKNRFIFVLSIVIYGLVLIVYCFGWIKGFPYLYMHANRMYRGNYILFYPMALAGIVLTNNLLEFLSSKIKLSVFEYVGRNSMNFYVTHWILFVLVTFIVKYIFKIDSPETLFAILICSSIVFLPLISKAINILKSHNSKLNNIL